MLLLLLLLIILVILILALFSDNDTNRSMSRWGRRRQGDVGLDRHGHPLSDVWPAIKCASLFLHSFLFMFVFTYLKPYLSLYIYIYIHTYIHIYICSFLIFWIAIASLCPTWGPPPNFMSFLNLYALLF